MNLPRESATSRAVNPNWAHTPELEMLRSIEWYERIADWRFVSSNTKGATDPAPDPHRFDWEPDPDEREWDGTWSNKGDPLAWSEAAEQLGGDERMTRLMGV